MVERRLYRERPPRHEYRPTAKGEAFHAVLLTLRAWGEAWCKAPGAERAVEYIHCDCEGLAGPGPACAARGAPVEWQDLHAEPGVAYGKEREAHWRAFNARRSEEPPSELPSLKRHSYAVFPSKNKTNHTTSH